MLRRVGTDVERPLSQNMESVINATPARESLSENVRREQGVSPGKKIKLELEDPKPGVTARVGFAPKERIAETVDARLRP